jgi:glycosyltransferase involved in cell wall biosynthesis
VDWRLELAGKGSLIPEMSRLAHSLGLGERVRLHGFVSDAELEQLYAQAHLFLMPAVQGYGIPAIEALRRNLPVLLHRESGVSDILLDTPWATVFEGDEAQLTPALLQAIGGVLAGSHADVPPPRIPTEEEWAEQVAAYCGYTSRETPCR